LTVAELDQFQPDFYVTVATVLPLLLLVANLVRVYLARWRPGAVIRMATLFWMADYQPPGTRTPIDRKVWPRAVAIAMACLNVIAELTCLIVLFVRGSDTLSSVIIWAGVGCSLAWILLLLIAYIGAEPPQQSTGEESTNPR
jgi:hypothetical protein